MPIDYRKRDRPARAEQPDRRAEPLAPRPAAVAGADPSAAAQLALVVEASRQVASRFHEGTVRPFPLLDRIPAMDGFALSTGTGAAIVYADVTDAAPDSWNLQISAAVAFDVPHRPEIGMWLNELNHGSVQGKYYYRVTPDGALSAVVWEALVWSRLLTDFGGSQGQGIVLWLSHLFADALDRSSAGAAEFTGRFGGRILAPTDQDLTTLFVVSSG